MRIRAYRPLVLCLTSLLVLTPRASVASDEVSSGLGHPAVSARLSTGTYGPIRRQLTAMSAVPQAIRHELSASGSNEYTHLPALRG